MKILHLILSQGFAGSERYAAELASWQAHQKHRVLLVIPEQSADPATGADIADQVQGDVQIGRVGTLQRLGVALQAWSFRPDIIHTHLGAAGRRIRFLPLPGATVATLHRWYKRRNHAHHDGLICISSGQRADIPAGYQGAVETIGNWTRPRKIPAGHRAEVRRELGIKPGEYLFGAAGRLHADKGFDTLLDAFSQAQIADSRLVIFGSGPEEAALKAKAPPGTIFAGFRPKLPFDLASLDAFVLPSRFEPFGLVLLEAMAAGLPVAATRTAGPLEILGEASPYLVAPGDAAALAQVLRRLRMTSPPDHDLKAFSLAGQAARIEAFYDRVMARHKGYQSA